MSAGINKPHVLVFRKRLLAYSETFIADQGKFLSNYHAAFVGFHEDNTGRHLLDDLDVCLQSEHAALYQLARLRLRLGLGLNSTWKQALSRYQPQLIHAHFGPDALAALPIAQSLKIPLVATFHGFDITKNTSSTIYHKKRHLVFEQADKIIAVSNYIKSALLEHGCPEDKVIQHYIGINTDLFSGAKQEVERPRVVFIGRLVPKKGCRYLLEAMNLVQREIPEVELHIIGDGPLRTELESLASGLNNVVFQGVQNQQEIKQALSAAWVFCTPSIIAESGDAEGLGMVFLEAQALGTPAVSFDTGGVVEAIANRQTGRTIKERDVPALAQALVELLSNQELRKEYGEAGAERVRSEFDIKKQCKKLEVIYEQVISER